MSWIGTVRAFARGLGGQRNGSRQREPGEQQHRFFVNVHRRPMRVTVTPDSPDALLAAVEAGEAAACKASGAMQLRGVARINGRLVALHDLDPMNGPDEPPNDGDLRRPNDVAYGRVD